MILIGFIQGIAIRPEPLRQRLVDNDHGRAAVIPIRECAAAHDGNVEGLEVAGGHHCKSRCLQTRNFGTSRNLECVKSGRSSGTQWQLPRPPLPEARGCGERLLASPGSLRRLVELRTRQADMRIVSTLCVSKPGFTCRMATKVRISSAAAINSTTASVISVVTSSARVLTLPRARACAIAVLLQRRAQVRPRRSQGRNESKQNARQNR